MKKSYIEDSSVRAKEKIREFVLFGKINVRIDDQPEAEFSIRDALKKIEKTIPEHLVDNISNIYIGNFKDLKDREIDSLYYAGSIFITPKQVSEKDLILDIIHEIAHAVEESYREVIISSNIEREFLGKRKILYSKLYKLGNLTNLQYNLFMNPIYNLEFDDLMYKEVGYNLLYNSYRDIFPSPYGVTSLREYFATGFEDFFNNTPEYNISMPTHHLRIYCPELFNLLKELTQLE